MSENKYIATLHRLFEMGVEIRDKADWQPKHEGKPYYHRWFSTSDIGDLIDDSLPTIRYRLNQLEKQGLVTSQRRPNYVLWSTDYPGFKNHRFTDYAERV